MESTTPRQIKRAKLIKTKKRVQLFWWTFFSCLGAFLLVILLAIFGVFGKMPSLKQLENPSMLQSSEVYAADGTLMGKYYREKGNRSNVNYKDISKHVINALVATEDERFYNHAGIDVKSTGRAIFLFGRQGGGSTITQQLAKTLLGQGSKNFAMRIIEKLKEYIIALRLERNFTKEEILALYLNAVPYGDNVYGIRNASRTFFSKEPDRLDPNEAAVLVGMLKGNFIYNPRVRYKASFERKNVVLGQMEKNNYLNPSEAARYKAMPIPLNYKKMDENAGYAPYFREVLKEELKEALKGMENPDGEPYNIYDDGLKVYTTINTQMQTYAEESIAQQMPVLQRALNSQRNIRSGSVWEEHENVLAAAMKVSDRWKAEKEDGLTDAEIKKTFYEKVPMKVFAWNAKREKDTVMTPYDSIRYHRQMMQTAFMVMDPVTGEVKAWVGGINFKTFKYDHANLNTKRQVGSSIKPFLYAQAMEERGFTAESNIPNEAQYFEGNGWVPASKKCLGLPNVTMAGALAFSLNCASAYLMKQIGPAQFSNFLERINIPTRVKPYPSNALGAVDLSLYEMLWGYSIFGGRGFSSKPYFISRIEDRNGNVIKRFDYSSNRKEAISEVTAYNMTRMLEGPVTRGTAAGLKQQLGATEMGGKTGTTNDNADAWFFGFSPQLLAGVWVGCDDRFIRIESAQGYGGTAARPIWQTFFQKVYNDKKLGIFRDAVFPKPADLNNQLINADIPGIIEESLPNAEGNNVGNGSANEYSLDTTSGYIPPESQRPVDENASPKEKPKKDTGRLPKIGDRNPADNPSGKKEKKGFLRGIFGKKEKKEEKPPNDY